MNLSTVATKLIHQRARYDGGQCFSMHRGPLNDDMCAVGRLLLFFVRDLQN